MHLLITYSGAAKAKVLVDETVLMMFQSFNYMSQYSYRFNV